MVQFPQSKSNWGIMPEPTRLNNRYQLEEILGSGGMAIVYRAYDSMLERTVAIKILRQDFTRDAGFRENFRQEAKAAANLSHPNIVTVHDFGFDAGHLFIVMEYVPGTDLKSLLKTSGRMSIEETLDMLIQACAGVGYAHRAGLVHCDIKPQNMLITPEKRLKVVDFGIARALASIHPDEKTEVVWGSPQYFSPEQAAGAAPSPASDVYSIGVIMYEALTGQLPFKAESGTELARLHREVMPAAPRALNPSIPPSLEQILLKVLAKEPSTRYRTADQLGRVLETYRQQKVVQVELSTSGVPSTQSAPLPSFNQTYYPPTPAKRIEPASPQANPFQMDWVTIALGLLALIAVGGLIPFFLWVYFVYNPPIR